MNRIRIFLVAAQAILVFLVSTAHAQYPFGKNKVLYAPKDWKIIETEHVDIYYYPDELPAAEFVAAFADSAFREFSSFLRVEFERRIPVVLYGTHHDFQETNVTPYLVSESTAGFTEFVKGRIALPFAGSYPRLRHVFRHELVHAIMIEKLRAVMSSRRRWGYEGPPLWFVEGLAEYLARREPDSEAHLFLRDAVANGLVYSLEEIWRIEGSYLMYKEGESAVGYIATRYGAEALVILLENWWRYDRFPVLVERTLGVSLRELGEDWHAYLRRRYFPSALDRRAMGEIGEEISPRESPFAMHPVCSRGGGRERVLCVGYHRGSMNILELSRDRKGLPRSATLVRGGRRRRSSRYRRSAVASTRAGTLSSSCPRREERTPCMCTTSGGAARFAPSAYRARASSALRRSRPTGAPSPSRRSTAAGNRTSSSAISPTAPARASRTISTTTRARIGTRRCRSSSGARTAAAADGRTPTPFIPATRRADPSSD